MGCPDGNTPVADAGDCECVLTRGLPLKCGDTRCQAAGKTFTCQLRDNAGGQVAVAIIEDDASCTGPAQCTQQCGDDQCGIDPICKEPCGTCGAGTVCEGNPKTCEPTACIMACGTRMCGPDSAGCGNCGTCAVNKICSSDGMCEDPPEDSSVIKVINQDGDIMYEDEREGFFCADLGGDNYEILTAVVRPNYKFKVRWLGDDPEDILSKEAGVDDHYPFFHETNFEVFTELPDEGNGGLGVGVYPMLVNSDGTSFSCRATRVARKDASSDLGATVTFDCDMAVDIPLQPFSIEATISCERHVWPRCGNGLVDEQEGCDDGNDNSLDSCINCKRNIGEVCSGDYQCHTGDCSGTCG